MLLMSWSTFRERWQLFIGAIVTVCLGVALVQASLLILVAAANPTIPSGLSDAEELALREGYDGATALLGMILGLAAFVAIFIVASTFAFTVAQRRRDLALLRLTGASRRQVRRLLLGEALLLGMVGTALGSLFGLPVMWFEGWLLDRLGFLPAGFSPEWRSWVLAVSAGTGVGIAVLGVLGASRRASRVRPLEALRDTGRAARVMTWSRWLIGIIFLAGGTAMVTAASAAGGEAALALSLMVCIVLVIGFSALSPLVVPLVGLLFRGVPGVLGQLAVANLRDGVRRSASTAAPIMVLVGLVVGLGGTLDLITAGSRAEATRTITADLVVTSPRPVMDQLEKLDGVRTVSEETQVAVELDGTFSDGVAIDAAAYAQTHRVKLAAGSLASLRGNTIAVTPAYAGEQPWRLGGTVHASFGDQTRDLRIVALLPTTVAGPAFLLPHSVAPSDGPRQYLVKVDSNAAVSQIEAANLGEVSTVADWIQRDVAERQDDSVKVMVALLGMAALYTIIAMINAVVIAAADRGAEFATARLTGLNRAQVVRAVLWESLAVVAVGILLGGLAAAGTVAGVAAAISSIVGATVISVPWQMFGALVLGSVVVVGVTSVLTTLATTRQSAVTLANTAE